MPKKEMQQDTYSVTSSDVAQDSKFFPSSSDPLQQVQSKSEILSSLNPFKRRDKSPKPKQEEDIPPRLKEAIEQMEKNKQRKLEEMEAQGIKPNDRTRGGHGAYGAALGAAGLIGGGGGC